MRPSRRHELTPTVAHELHAELQLDMRCAMRGTVSEVHCERYSVRGTLPSELGRAVGGRRVHHASGAGIVLGAGIVVGAGLVSSELPCPPTDPRPLNAGKQKTET